MTARPDHATYDAHLAPDLLERAQRHLCAKAIAEFAHERLLAPQPDDGRPGGWHVTSPDDRSTWTFTARRHPLEHWVVDPGSLGREVDGRQLAPDAQELVVDFAAVLGIPDRLLPTYLEELASTLGAACWKLAHATTPAAALVRAGHQEVEAAMTEGHPAFVANNGRIGFGADDYAAYAPEAGRDVRLLWLAVRRDQSRLSLAHGLDEETHYRRELGDAALARFAGVLAARGCDPADYRYLPVHPWQWANRLAITFAPSVARRDVVLVGEGPGAHRAQQSIRTFFPVDHPERSYVKTALAIQNMGFLRGLSPAYMAATPAVNDWVAGVVAGDPTLRECGFTVLREHAAIGWTGDVFHRLDTPSPYRKMVAALWRESPRPGLAPGERLVTMAALLHRDHDGASYVGALLDASPYDARTWLRAYLRAYLRPLVHCLLRHDLVFMPHGENLILVLRDGRPVRAVMKDIGEEVAVLGDAVLPPAVERIRVDMPEEMRSLAIHMDVFDGFLRHLGAIMAEDGLLAGEDFWAEVARCLREHAEDHPELADAVARHDLARPTFRHGCLNRLQLRDTLQMVDLAEPAGSLVFAGELDNPVAAVAAAPVG